MPGESRRPTERACATRSPPTACCLLPTADCFLHLEVRQVQRAGPVPAFPAAYCRLLTTLESAAGPKNRTCASVPGCFLPSADCLLHLKVRQAQRTGPVRAFPAAFCLLLSAYCRLTSAFWPKRSVTIAAST
jgi:hypothetical protein